MSSHCTECGDPTKKFFISGEGADVCKACYNAGILSNYVQRMSKSRLDKELNKRAFDQCSEIAAWLSVYRFGNEAYRKRAARIINALVETRNKAIKKVL